jgi:transcriptional regulator with XRE-family HTH domain
MYRDDLIRAEMGRQNLARATLAEKAGLNINTVYAICRGKEHVEVPTLAKVAESLGLTMQQLFEPKPEAEAIAA